MYLDIVDQFRTIAKVTRTGKTVTVTGINQVGESFTHKKTYVHTGVAVAVTKKIKLFLV